MTLPVPPARGDGAGWRATVCRPGELGAPEIDAWHRFQRADLTVSNPFLSPEFAVAVDAERPDVRVAVVERDGQLAGFLAHTVGRLGIAGPVAPGMCDAQAFVHRPDLIWQPAAVLDAAGLRVWRHDHLVGGQAGGAEPPADDDADVDGASDIEGVSWCIDLTEGWEGYTRWARANRGRYLNWLERKRRRFDKDHPDASFAYAGSDPAGLAALMALKSEQCRRMGWVDIFSRGWVRALVERLADVDTPALTGGLSALRVGDRVVAADFSLRSTTVYAGWLIAYDTELASSSPGAVRWRHLLEAAAGDGIREVDLGKGVDDFKRRFATGTRPLAEGMWAGSGTLPAGLEHADRVVRRVRAGHPEAEQRLRALVRQARRRRTGPNTPDAEHRVTPPS